MAISCVLSQGGIEKNRIIGLTPPYSFVGSTRGTEIQAWLDSVGVVDSYLILDDVDDGLDIHSDRVVFTEDTHGLLPEHLPAMREIINAPYR